MIVNLVDSDFISVAVIDGVSFDQIQDKARSYDIPVCIEWKWLSDGTMVYWSPAGPSLVPHWYNVDFKVPWTKPEHFKKRQVNVQLPRWMINRLNELDKPNQLVVMEALLEKFNWTPPIK